MPEQLSAAGLRRRYAGDEEDVSDVPVSCGPSDRATTIGGWIAGLVAAHGDRPCVISADQTLTFAQLDRASSAIARGLLARGIGKGSRVGLLLGNGPSWVTWWAAVSRIGAVCIPLSTFMQPAELARVVRHSDVQYLVATPRFLNRDFIAIITEAFPELSNGADPNLALASAPYLRTVVLVDAPQPWARDTDWVIGAGRDDRWMNVLNNASTEIHTDDDAICIYTSGQSADPKGVVHTHGTVVGKAHYLREMFGFTPDTTATATMPFFWVGGLVMSLLPAMDAGAATRCPERSTWQSGVAVIGNTAAGSDTAAEHMRGFTKLPALGMTETFGIYSWGNVPVVPEFPLATPMDDLQPGFELRLCDEHGAEVPDGSPGEILLRGPTVTARLHKVDRSATFDADGFYRTGDLAVRHGARASFMGRKQDTIKTSGANVSPAEVERELTAIDDVQHAFVVGLDDDVRGQVVGAAVVPTPGATLRADQIRQRLRGRLSPYKVPRAIIILSAVDEVPMTPSMKVRKQVLAELIRARTYGEGGSTV